MTITSTTSFNLDLADLIEEAYERCGVEVRTGHQVQTARRSLNLLLIEWQNRGVNLWTIDQQQVPLQQGVDMYTIPADTVDILDTVVRRTSGGQPVDQVLTRMALPEYAQISNKQTVGTPLRIYVDRQTLQPQVTLWPVPDKDDLVLVYWRMRRIKDAGTGANTQDVPYRFLPCLVAGLAFYLSMKVPEALPRAEGLKLVYDEQWMMAAQEDRDRASFFIAPSRYS